MSDQDYTGAEDRNANADASADARTMPDRPTPDSTRGIDDALGTAPGNTQAPGTDDPTSDAGPITQDYSDITNPGVTSLDEEFAGSEGLGGSNVPTFEG